jgi:hypothetical protein
MAGKEVCVSAPREDYDVHCAAIVGWTDHRTPVPAGEMPYLAGLRGCDSSLNCPAGSVCCLHMIGNADIQATTCHASLDECGGPAGSLIEPREICDPTSKTPGCRGPGTVCTKEMSCEPRPGQSPGEEGFEKRWLLDR